MKKTLKKTMLLVTIIGFSANVFGGSADQKILTKEQLIEQLNPNSKPSIKMRGIRMTKRAVQPKQVASAPEKAPSISLNVNFAYNSHELNEIALKQLRPLGEALKSGVLNKFGFAIEGHTDAVGGDEYNMTLSQRRALAIGNFLYQNYSIEPSRLSLKGKGETELLDTSNPDSQVNRRVQVTTIVSK